MLGFDRIGRPTLDCGGVRLCAPHPVRRLLPRLPDDRHRGLASDDLYERLKLIDESAPLIEAHQLDLDTVHDALLAEFGARAG